MNAPAPKPAPKAAAKATETVVAGFKLDTGLDIPAVTRGTATAPAYPFADMPVNTSFLLPITVPAEIKDDKEREAWQRLADCSTFRPRD